VGNEGGDGEMKFEMQLKTVTEGNAKEHWRTKAKRAREQKRTTWLHMVVEATQQIAMGSALGTRVGFCCPIVVTMTRIGRRLDNDNIYGALKHVRDAIADGLGIDDRHEDLVRYDVAQENGKSGGVRVEIKGTWPIKTAKSVLMDGIEKRLRAKLTEPAKKRAVPRKKRRKVAG
jgi:Holliday junction resolvase RusA-like endonuclease